VAGSPPDRPPITPAGQPAGVDLPSSARDRHLAELGVLVVMAFWAGNFIVVKGAIGILPPVGFTFLRYVVAAVTLLLLLRWREGSFRLPRGDTLKIAVLGMVGFGCYQILWTVALDSIPAGDSALLIAATPVMTALLAVALGVDAPNAAKLIGALISFVGVAMVIAAGQGLDLGASLGGDLLTLAAALCWAIYTTVAAGMLRRHSPLVATTWAIVAGAIFIAPVGIGQLATADLSGFGLPVVLAILYSGTLAAGFANVIIFQGVKLLGPTRVTSLQSLVPALAVVLAAVFLGEELRPIQIVGGIVILAGVALLRRGSWPSRPTASVVRRLAG
jgi:drug/metabolite transporter (DMT)-like permease